MKVIVHGMGGVINEVWMFNPDNIKKLSKVWYPDNPQWAGLLEYELNNKGYHSFVDGEEGYSELVVMDVLE